MNTHHSVFLNSRSIKFRIFLDNFGREIFLGGRVISRVFEIDSRGRTGKNSVVFHFAAVASATSDRERTRARRKSRDKENEESRDAAKRDIPVGIVTRSSPCFRPG